MKSLPEIRESISHYFQNMDNVAAVYLFGSVLGKNQSLAEDIDIAVLFYRDMVPDFFERLESQVALTDILRKEVDLVALNTVSPILKMQVLKKGELVLVKDKKKVNEFFVRTVNEYFDLKQVRRPIEEKLLKHPIIHD